MDPVLAIWRLRAERPDLAPVIPDGCRDLIFHHPANGPPRWFVSALGDHTYQVRLQTDDTYVGYRLKPGVRIDETQLVAALAGRHHDEGSVRDRLDSCTTFDERTRDALTGLADSRPTVAAAACNLGVGVRSLQRLITRQTGFPPGYWLRLARARRAGRAIAAGLPLAEVAAMAGFTDQPHLSHEIRRWFGVSPAGLRQAERLRLQLFEPGYG